MVWENADGKLFLTITLTDEEASDLLDWSSEHREDVDVLVRQLLKDAMFT